SAAPAPHPAYRQHAQPDRRQGSNQRAHDVRRRHRGPTGGEQDPRLHRVRGEGGEPAQHASAEERPDQPVRRGQAGQRGHEYPDRGAAAEVGHQRRPGKTGGRLWPGRRQQVPAECAHRAAGGHRRPHVPGHPVAQPVTARTTSTAPPATSAPNTTCRKRRASSRRNTRSPPHQPSNDAGTPTSPTCSAGTLTCPASANPARASNPLPVKITASVARNTRGSYPMAWNAATSGGPLVPVEVARTPASAPSPSTAGRVVGMRSPRQISTAHPATTVPIMAMSSRSG